MTSIDAKPVGAVPGGDAAPPHLVARNVRKSFGGSLALDGVELTLRKGEIHALVGANGAGKSTLARIVAGHLRPDAAEIAIAGRPANIHSPRDAINHGVAMVTQQLSLAGHMSVAENIMLTELGRPGLLNRSALFRRAGEMLHAVNPADDIDLRAETRTLPSAHRQLVEIAKALSQNPRVIIFDEPTTSLTPFEVERLFEVMESLTRQDKALVFVSHRLEEIFTICKMVTVLRDGRNVCASVPMGDLDQAKLIQLIIGRDIGKDIYGGGAADQSGAGVSPGASGRSRPGAGEPVLEVRNLRRPPMVRDVSFTLHKGEILGLAGLVGAGRSETARLIFGLDQPQGGEIFLRGRAVSAGSPRASYRRKMAMIPEDRKTQGAIPDFTVRENIMIGHSAAFSHIGTGYAGLLPAVLDIIRELRLDPQNLAKFILELSGGMQQKAMLSRALLVDPEILILDEPTQGVDIGTRSDIDAILRRLAARGIAMLFISSDFEEILGICDRLVVLSEGRSVAEVDAALMDEEKLTMFAAPRTSARSTTDLIQALVRRWPEACGYWVYFGHDRVYCFNRQDCREDLDLGFRAGDVAVRSATCLAPFALDAAGGVAAGPEPGLWRVRGDLASMLAERHNARGHRLGYIGLTMRKEHTKPEDGEEFARLVREWE